MKKVFIIIAVLITANVNAQYYGEYEFGKISAKDTELIRYENDTTANAIVLFEKGNSEFKVKDERVVIGTKYYFKKKIFNKDGAKHATFNIPLYNNKVVSEKVEDIRAITHNGIKRTILQENHIYTTKKSDNWTEVSFTLPDIKDNSIIEVEYTLYSPFKFKLTGWEFQSDIPKLYSEYIATIPGNYTYNRQLRGFLRLTKN